MNILLLRGLDQFIFRGMDRLGQELTELGHNCIVKAPMFAHDGITYDIVIGNSQGSVEAMNRRQVTKPKLVVTVDIPAHPLWKPNTGLKHLNIHGSWGRAGLIPGAENVFIDEGHLALSYSPEMRKLVKEAVAKVK